MADGEYEPKDSRNVTGTAATPDGRWTNRDRAPPLANGERPAPRPYRPRKRRIIEFEIDPEFEQMLEAAEARRRGEVH